MPAESARTGGVTAQQATIDFFISRAGSDSDIAVLVAGILRKAGFKTLLQDEDFGHASFMAMMAHGWSSGARIICLLSGNYQKSEYCKAEYEVVLASDPRNLKQRVIVLRIAECAPIEHLAALKYDDLVPVLHDATAFANAVRSAVGAAVDSSALSRRAPKQIVHRAIEPNPSFAGREEDLARLREALSLSRPAALTSSGNAAAVSGLGGIGKSVLAREFAWRHRGDYHGLWWIRAEEHDTLLDDLVELGSHFIPGLQSREDRVAAARETLDHLWQGHFPKPWLLIYDNVEKPGDLEHLTPRGGAHTLITSRWPHFEDATEVPVDVFPKDVAVAYLQKRARKSDPMGAARLAEALGCLPLALDHAASYCIGVHRTFDAYARELATFIKTKPAKGRSKGQYPDSVWGTFNLALDRVIAGDAERGVTAIPEAERLMRLLAFTAPDNFPLDAIRPREAGGIMSDIEKGEAAAALQEASLIRLGTFEDGRPHISVHRLVQQVMRSRLDAAGQFEAAAESAMRLLLGQFVEFETPSGLSWAKRLAAHATAVLEHAPIQGAASGDTSHLMDQVGYWQHTRGDRTGAEGWYNRSLAIRQKLAAADPDWLRAESVSYSRLADLRLDVGDRPGAQEYLEKSLAITGKLLKAVPNWTDVQGDLATCLERLAELLLLAGDRAGAMAHCERSLAIRQQLVAANPELHYWQTGLSVSLEKIADLQEAAGDRAGALATLEKSLVIRERLSATDRQQAEWERGVSGSLSRIADLLLATGDRAGALVRYEKAMAIRQRVAASDRDRPDWQRDLWLGFLGIAEVHIASGNSAEALTTLEQALAITETLAAIDPSYLEWQRDRSICLERIGDVKMMTGDLLGATANYEKSMTIQQRLVAADHGRPDRLRGLAMAIERLGDIRFAGGDQAGALGFYEQCLDIRQQLTAVDPDRLEWLRDLAGSYDKLGDTLLAAGRYAEALANQRERLDIVQRMVAAAPADLYYQADLAISLFSLVLAEAVAGAKAGPEVAQCCREYVALAVTSMTLAPQMAVHIRRIVQLMPLSSQQIATLMRARDMLQHLDRDGRLTAEQKGFLVLVEAGLSGAGGGKSAGSGFLDRLRGRK